jgi:hypothetical protein
MTVGRPHRPTSDSPEQLGFTKAKPVAWLGPRMLLNTAGRVVLSDLFGAYLDKRELQSSLACEVHDERPGGSDEAELWFDFVADVGDGFNATYTIAYLLGQDTLEVAGLDGVDKVLPRGHFLMVGGDEIYPTPTAQRYEDKTKGPYTAALPDCPETGPANMYALPGNHDWYDGLTSFMRLFVKDGKDHIGGWNNAQSRSYFAIKLPHNWWLFAIDTQFGAYLDDPQLDYFHKAKALLKSGDRIILCGPSPSWVEAVDDPHAYDTINFFLRTVLNVPGVEVKLMLSGDLHHYARYGGPDRQLIHCGGGGAYLYPTHRMPERIQVPPPASIARRHAEPVKTYELSATFPTKNQSRAYAAGVFTRLPLRNPGFMALLGLLQTGFMLAFIGLFLHPNETVRRWLEVPAALAVLVFLAATVAFAKSPTDGSVNVGRRWFIGLTHGLMQIAAGVAATWAWSELPFLHSPWPWPIPLTLIYLAAMGIVSTAIFCVYLLIASSIGVNSNELFSSQAIIDSKSFLRLHIDETGMLTIYPIAVPKVSRAWRANPRAEKTHSWLVPTTDIKYELVEPPIEIR